MRKDDEINLANVDVTSYPKDKAVLLTRTDNTMSVGVINMDYMAITCWFAEIVDKQKQQQPSRIDMASFDSPTEAINYAFVLIQEWLSSMSDEGDDDTQSSALIQPENIIHFIKDAPYNKPQISRDGETPLPLSQQLEKQEELLRIKDQGFHVSTAFLVNAFFSDLSKKDEL